MKLNKILMALSAMAIVGCSSEDFNDPSVTQAIDDSRLIQLDENFILAGVGEVNTTRTHWDTDATTGAFVNQFLPIWATAPGGANMIDADANLKAQEVGLCWLGNGAVGTDVYTNYEFYHFGWLNKEETEADIDKCGSLYNGSLYNEITAAAGTAGKEAVPGTDWVVAGLPAKSVKAGLDNLNYNSGIYKTENKAIFGGQYIVYYPYNEDFEDAGTIPAVAETNWANVPTDWKSAEIGHATFRYSAPVTIEGGHQAANFGLKNLSAIAQLRVASVAGDPCIGNSIDQIVLYSASGKLLKQANLAADKIAAGATGADLYAATEGTKTIVTTFAAAQALQAKESTTITSAYITVLPTTVDDLVALVHNSTNGTWAQISLGNTEFKAGSAKRLDIIVKAADFTTDFIAVDEASLTASLTAANAVVTADATARPQITVIGDITLATNPYDITTATYANSDKITIKGDDIIVPELVTLNLETNMESEVRVLGTSCCSGAATGGRLDVQGGTISDVTMEPTEARVTAANYDNINPQITYSAAATVAAGKTVNVKAGNVTVSAAVLHKGDIVIAEGAKVTVTGAPIGDLKFVDSNVTNNGTIEVEKAGKFDMTDSGSTTVAAGQRMTNNGTFIHNVNAQVGTAVQNMNQNGEYRCKVENQNQLDDAYLQWTACNVIEMVNAGAVSYDLKNACQHKVQGVDKYIDIEVNSGALTTFNNPTDTNKGDALNIQIGNLTVIAGGLDVVFVGTAAPNNKRTLTVNGDMNVAAATTLTSSKGIVVTENLTVVEGAAATTLTYLKNNGSFAVTKNITVSGNATFDASVKDALNITCANFYLTKVGANGGTAIFGNRTASTSKNLVVSGTISNPEGCTFNILAAAGTDVYAWVTCTELIEGGTFSAARPRVVAAN